MKNLIQETSNFHHIIMVRDRFLKILEFLHFSTVKVSNKSHFFRSDSFSKVYEITELFIINWQSHFDLDQIDVSICIFQGKSE